MHILGQHKIILHEPCYEQCGCNIAIPLNWHVPRRILRGASGNVHNALLHPNNPQNTIKPCSRFFLTTQLAKPECKPQFYTTKLHSATVRGTPDHLALDQPRFASVFSLKLLVEAHKVTCRACTWLMSSKSLHPTYKLDAIRALVVVAKLQSREHHRCHTLGAMRGASSQ